MLSLSLHLFVADSFWQDMPFKEEDLSDYSEVFQVSIYLLLPYVTK